MIPFLADLPTETRPAPAAAPAPAAPPAAPLASAPIEPAPAPAWHGAPQARDVAPPPPRPERLAHYGLSGRVGLGASYQRLYSLAITSGEFELGFGGRAGKHAGYLTASIERGRSEAGLHTAGYHAGVLGEWSVGRFRYGIQGRVGALFVRRATDTDDQLSSPSVGLRGHVAWDAVRFAGGNALGLELGLRAEYCEPIVYGPSLLATFRWESNRRVGGPR